MNIESLLKREGGSKIDLDDKVYHFKPNAAGAHVADVQDKAHVARFLAIPEGYAIYDPSEATKPAEKKEADEVLLGSDNFDASFEIHGATYSLGEVVAMAHTTSGLSVADWNELPVEERDAIIEAELDALDAAGPAPVLDLEALKAEYKEKTGNHAHHTWDAEKIAEKLAAL